MLTIPSASDPLRLLAGASGPRTHLVIFLLESKMHGIQFEVVWERTCPPKLPPKAPWSHPVAFALPPKEPGSWWYTKILADLERVQASETTLATPSEAPGAGFGLHIVIIPFHTGWVKVWLGLEVVCCVCVAAVLCVLQPDVEERLGWLGSPNFFQPPCVCFLAFGSDSLIRAPLNVTATTWACSLQLVPRPQHRFNALLIISLLYPGHLYHIYIISLRMRWICSEQRCSELPVPRISKLPATLLYTFWYTRMLFSLQTKIQVWQSVSQNTTVTVCPAWVWMEFWNFSEKSTLCFTTSSDILAGGPQWVEKIDRGVCKYV